MKVIQPFGPEITPTSENKSFENDELNLLIVF